MLEAYSELSPTLLVSENRSVSSRASPLSVKEDADEKISKMIGKKEIIGWLKGTGKWTSMEQSNQKSYLKMSCYTLIFYTLLFFQFYDNFQSLGVFIEQLLLFLYGTQVVVMGWD